jgi:hypothetical protein
LPFCHLLLSNTGTLVVLIWSRSELCLGHFEAPRFEPNTGLASAVQSAAQLIKLPSLLRTQHTRLTLGFCLISEPLTVQ